MTTLVIVALDDLALRVESNDPTTPAWLLTAAMAMQAQMRNPEITAVMEDLIIYGHCRLPGGVTGRMNDIPLEKAPP